MNKLEERFEKIIESTNTEVSINGVMAVRVSRLKETCADEVEQIAIEFARYKVNNGWVSFGGESYIRLIEKTKSESTAEKINISELFDKFIEEYYDKIADK